MNTTVVSVLSGRQSQVSSHWLRGSRNKPSEEMDRNKIIETIGHSSKSFNLLPRYSQASPAYGGFIGTVFDSGTPCLLICRGRLVEAGRSEKMGWNFDPLLLEVSTKNAK